MPLPTILVSCKDANSEKRRQSWAEATGPLRPDESRVEVEIRIKKKVMAKLGG